MYKSWCEYYHNKQAKSMYFFKIKYRYSRTYKTLRCKSTISAIIKFLLTLPFCMWKDIETIKIERIH